MNAIDRLVTWASPEAGLRRMQARALADHVTRITQSYDAATAGRRTDGWARPSTSANGAMLSKVQKLADGARDLARNDPYIASAMRKIRDTAVGTGIEVQWADEAMQEAFDRWCEYSDADCVLNFYGQQALAARTIPESGSVLARFRPRRTEDGFEIPLQIQLLEPDFLDTSRDGAKPKGSGYILNGIDFDAIGRRVGYYLFPVHPGEAASYAIRAGTIRSSWVSADNVLHAFLPERPGQVTGASWLSSSMMRARDLGDYEDAELFRKKIEACNVGWVTQPGGVTGQPLGPTPGSVPAGTAQGQASGDPRPEMFEPGTFHYGQQGETIDWNDPKGNTSYSPYTRDMKHAVGAGIGVPYMEMTGDVSQANYTSMRGGRLSFHAFMRSYRQTVLIPQLFNPILRRVALVAGAAGVVTRAQSMSAYECQVPPFEEVDPFREATGRQMDVRNGFAAPQDVIRARGNDPRKQLDKLQAWNKELDDREIVLDSDPRKVTRAGGAQMSDPIDPGGSDG